MSESQRGRDPKVTDEDLLTVLSATEDPFLTTAEVAAAVDIGRRAVADRLDQLHEAGELARKRAGQTDTWWVAEDSEFQSDLFRYE